LKVEINSSLPGSPAISQLLGEENSGYTFHDRCIFHTEPETHWQVYRRSNCINNIYMSRPLTSTEIRSDFFRFFRQKDHELVRSASLIPGDDPSLLFTNAGMNQFKDVFLETGTRSYNRAVNTQKCLRVSGKHNDLEEVGRDTYHHTFFEMLGNWSFGDYFKQEAIRWAWELLVNRWGLDPDRLYVTVHEGDKALGLDADHEAANFWKSETSINPDHVLYFGSKDNFWMMGDTGPCGPCSEIHVDLRTDEERKARPGAELVNADDPRVMEIWNLVFIQYNSLGKGKLENLSAQHVDTGMGFERIVAVLQHQSSNYDTDLFSSILNAIAERSPLEEVVSYENVNLDAIGSENARVAMRVIADHLRAVSFTIADGVSPGNVGRGYVIRRILRRAVRFGYQTLGFREPFLYGLVDVLVEIMGDLFPELKSRQSYIEKVIRAEEESFLETLGTGLTFFERVIPHIQNMVSINTSAAIVKHSLADKRLMDLLQKAYTSDNREEIIAAFCKDAGNGVIPGEVAFLLHDTYGFPIDLTELMAREVKLGVDMNRYEELMQDQKDRARSAASFIGVLGDDREWTSVRQEVPSVFLGYDLDSVPDARLICYKVDETDDGSSVVELVFDKTPFYAESGGQLGDRGSIQLGEEILEVVDTRKSDDKIVHIVNKLPDNLDSDAVLKIDKERRKRITKNHTATHLMHAALREVLGPHVGQKGSLVAPDRLRFDFSHYEKVVDQQLVMIARRVNEVIQDNIQKEEDRSVDYDEAISRGALALFGEKYGDKVRVITFDKNYSVELCGGTHVDAAGEIGVFRFLSEGSVAAGIRRVEAITGLDAIDDINSHIAEMDQIRSILKNTDGSTADTIARLLDEQKKLQGQIEKIRSDKLLEQLDGIVSTGIDIGGVKLITARVTNVDMNDLRNLASELRSRSTGNTVGILGGTSESEDKVYLVAVVTDDLIARIQAGQLIGHVAKIVGGGGGGRPELATAGGKYPDKLVEALEESKSIVVDLLQPVS